MLFEKKEYKERLKKVKDSMQKKGIDLLVTNHQLKDMENF